jgi:hypothetical protein
MLWVPINRTVTLLAGYSDGELPVEAAIGLNKSAFSEAASLVFGHRQDVRAFLQVNQNPWG